MPEACDPIQPRVVPLQGGRNFRDLGGYPAADGRRTRWGLLYRAGALTDLTASDWAALAARGLATVCDLRTRAEREAAPFACGATPPPAYWCWDYQLSFAVLADTLRSGFASGEAARAGMIAGYRELPFQQAPAHRQLLAYLKAGDIPLLFHCAAGKDRAGIAAALLLSALGVPRDEVIADFVLTDRIYAVEATLARRDAGKAPPYPQAVRAAIARADPAYLAAALDAIEARHGTIETYLATALDFGPRDLHALRARLLE